jgi:hypothetical protein
MSHFVVQQNTAEDGTIYRVIASHYKQRCLDVTTVVQSEIYFSTNYIGVSMKNKVSATDN